MLLESSSSQSQWPQSWSPLIEATLCTNFFNCLSKSCALICSSTLLLCDSSIIFYNIYSPLNYFHLCNYLSPGMTKKRALHFKSITEQVVSERNKKRELLYCNHKDHVLYICLFTLNSFHGCFPCKLFFWKEKLVLHLDIPDLLA
jgi:hypothetical protein